MRELGRILTNGALFWLWFGYAVWAALEVINVPWALYVG
jgi:hypothetical protein